MKKYEKPMVLTNSEVAEGVYLASGCYTVSAKIHQKPETGRGDYRIQVDGVHKADHTKEAQQLVISFNQNVVYKSSNGTCDSPSGTSLTINYKYHQNPNDRIGLGDLVVEADPGLAIIGVAIYD